MKKEKVLKIIKKLTWSSGYSDIEVENFFYNIGLETDLPFSIYARLDANSSWLQCEYWSKKLKKTIIWDYNVQCLGIKDSNDLADFIIKTSKDIKAFEKSILIKK